MMLLPLFFFALLSLVAMAAPALAADTYVQGYHRSDGTYVAPHYRSAPDSTPNNNWSTIPNVNPHTGQPGTRQPDFSPRLSPSPNYAPQPVPQPRRY
jgi:opacity protein-like surface antigen